MIKTRLPLIAMLAVAAGAALLGGSTRARAQNIGPALSVVVTSPVDGAFNVDVMNAAPAVGFSAYNVRLTFNPAKLAVVTAAYNPTSGPAVSATDLTFTPATATCPAAVVNNVAGSVSFGCASAPTLVINAAGTLVRFSFVTKAGVGGSVPLHLTTQAEMGLAGSATFDPDGSVQTNTLVDGTVTTLTDADGDGLPDTVDPCPANPDCDGDGVADGGLAPIGSGLFVGPDNCPLVPNGLAQGYQTNTDGNNSMQVLAGQDTLGDVCDVDISGDGYTNAQKTAAGKNVLVYCAARRADANVDGLVSIGDLAKVALFFGQKTLVSVDYAGQPNPPAPQPGASAPERYNQNGDTVITIGDLAKMAVVFGKNVSTC